MSGTYLLTGGVVATHGIGTGHEWDRPRSGRADGDQGSRR